VVAEAAERTQTPVGEAAPADLQSRVRTAAGAATGEAEFLDRGGLGGEREHRGRLDAPARSAGP